MHKRLAIAVVALSWSLALAARRRGRQARGRLQGEDHHHQEPPADEVLVAGRVRVGAAEGARPTRSGRPRRRAPTTAPGTSSTSPSSPSRSTTARSRSSSSTSPAATRSYVAGDPQYTRERARASSAPASSSAKPEFDVRKHYMMTVESRGRVIAHDPASGCSARAPTTAARSSSPTKMPRSVRAHAEAVHRHRLPRADLRRPPQLGGAARAPRGDHRRPGPGRAHHARPRDLLRSLPARAEHPGLPQRGR